jgi:GxxExxY protein
MAEIIYPELSYEIQGAFFDVYNELRHIGLSEKGWENALTLALAGRGIVADQQVGYELRYKGYRIGRFFVDILVNETVLVEVKATDELLPVDQAQVLTYLRVTGLKLGLLVNFGGAKLSYQRIPNFLHPQSLGEPRAEVHRASGSEEHLLFPELTELLRQLLYRVHAELGPGLMPMHYRRAFQIEMRLHDIGFEVKKQLSVRFRGQPIEDREIRLLVIQNRIAVLPVAVREITPLLAGRIRQYLRMLGLKLGLIANFHAERLDIRTLRVG